MDHSTPGKRLAPRQGLPLGGKIAIAAAAVLLALLVGGYAALCAFASGDSLYPNTSVMGVGVGGMTAHQAHTAVEDALHRRLDGQTVTISTPQDGQSFDLPADLAEPEGLDELLTSLSPAAGTPVYLRGFEYLRHLLKAENYTLSFRLTEQGAARLEEAARAYSSAFSDGAVPTSWLPQEDRVIFYRGRTGRSVDVEALKADTLAALTAADLTAPAAPITVQAAVTQTLPPELDLDDVARQVAVEARDACFDPETKTIVPSVTGISLDVDAARTLLENTPEGSPCSLPYTYIQPQVSTDELEATLFHDLLGTAKSMVTGRQGRITNVDLGRGYIDGTVLMPDEIFSFMALAAPYTAERGYVADSVYAGGGTRDELGGGLCQVSSTLYLACLRADLEIVERYQHAFEVAYLPVGMDATIYGDTLDYKFKNSTGYPMKIVFTMERVNGAWWLTAELYGTKVDDNYVVVTNKVLSTTPWSTVYIIDETVPAGTRIKKEDPHLGQKVEVYRNRYDGDGNLISSTLESVNNFHKLDRTYRINPADAAQYGVDPVNGGIEGSYQPEPSPSPEPSPDVTPSVPPETTPAPGPSPSQSPATEPPAPSETQTPVSTPPPGIPVYTPAPTPEPAPEPTPDGGVPLD